MLLLSFLGEFRSNYAKCEWFDEMLELALLNSSGLVFSQGAVVRASVRYWMAPGKLPNARRKTRRVTCHDPSNK